MTLLSKAATKLPFNIETWAAADIQGVAKRVSNPRQVLDAVILYTGKVGTGKTSLSTQHAYYLSMLNGTPFSLQNYFFTPLQAFHKINEAKFPPGTPLLFDESITGLLGVSVSSYIGQMMLVTFSTCRSKRYPILVCVPYINRLAQWFISDRALFCYLSYFEKRADGSDKPGYYVGMNYDNMVRYYELKKARKDWMIPGQVATTQEGRFTNWPFGKHCQEVPFTEEEYEEYKRKSLLEWSKAKIFTKGERWKQQRDIAIRNLSETGYSEEQIAQKVRISEYVVREILGKSEKYRGEAAHPSFLVPTDPALRPRGLRRRPNLPISTELVGEEAENV